MSAYTLLNNNQIVTGPRDWNPKYFEYFLNQEFGIEYTLPDIPIGDSISFNDSVRLVPTYAGENPTVDPLFEMLAGPQFSFDENNNHIATFFAQELPIENVKTNLKDNIAATRYSLETTPITTTLVSNTATTVTLNTDRESRLVYGQSLAVSTSTYSANWKFQEGFFTITQADLESIVNTVTAYVQSCFDWEAEKTVEIDAKTSVADLKLITLTGFSAVDTGTSPNLTNNGRNANNNISSGTPSNTPG